MAVSVLDKSEALRLTAASVGLTNNAAASVSGALIAQLLRRAVLISAPCTSSVVRDLAFNALKLLYDDPVSLTDMIETALEDLIAIGDVFEMRGEDGLVIRPAPPAFVLRRDNMVVLLGVAGDFLTPPTGFHIDHQQNGLRTITPSDLQNCRQRLLEAGLVELPEKSWLHGPKAIPSSTFFEMWMAKLPEARPEVIEGVEVLNSAKPTTYYKGRWEELNKRHDGVFVARRPQRYSAKLWCLAHVGGGAIKRFIDIHATDSRIRPCDEAWRLQAAIDAKNGTPQKVALSSSGGVERLSFSSPLPAWAIRRLSIVGARVPLGEAWLAFDLFSRCADAETQWLAETLWLQRSEGGTK